MYTPLEIDEYKAQFHDTDADYILLDVRTPEEYAEVRIPGAVLIPLDDLMDRVAEISREKPLVVVCRSGGRSMMGIQTLRMAGFQQALYNLEGGTMAWARKGYPTEQG